MTIPFLVSVRAALEIRLNAIASPLATAWENSADYSPVKNVPYQLVNILFAEPVNPEMNGRYIQQEGYMQVTLRYPHGAGSKDCMTQAQAIRDWFYRGLQVAANGITVTINRTPNVSPGALDGDRYAVPVKIRFITSATQ
jgi:hypothetical protein